MRNPLSRFSNVGPEHSQVPNPRRGLIGETRLISTVEAGKIITTSNARSGSARDFAVGYGQVRPGDNAGNDVFGVIAVQGV